MRVTNRSTIHDARDVHTPPPTARTPSTVSTLRVTSIDRSSTLSTSRRENSRARVAESTRKLFPSRARRVRPTASRTRDAYCARERPISVEFEWARACAFLHSSIMCLFEYVHVSRTHRWFSGISYTSVRARRESRWGKENGRETTTRETATMSTPAKENSRGDGGTVKTPSSVRARGEARGTRERWGRGDARAMR